MKLKHQRICQYLLEVAVTEIVVPNPEDIVPGSPTVSELIKTEYRRLTAEAVDWSRFKLQTLFTVWTVEGRDFIGPLTGEQMRTHQGQEAQGLIYFAFLPIEAQFDPSAFADAAAKIKAEEPA